MPLSEGGEISEMLIHQISIDRQRNLSKTGNERKRGRQRTYYMGPPNVPTPTPNPFNTLPTSNPPIPPKSSNCMPAPSTYSPPARNKHPFRPNLEQKGIPSGTPNSAPTSQEVMICACVDARAAGERPEREKCSRKEGSTIMPPMKPTE
jgi:hypothetical protein